VNPTLVYPDPAIRFKPCKQATQERAHKGAFGFWRLSVRTQPCGVQGSNLSAGAKKKGPEIGAL
jgi:hypothetical protein